MAYRHYSLLMLLTSIGCAGDTASDDDSDVSVNGVPVADAITVETNQNVSVDIVLTGTDPDGDALTYELVDAPGFGSISGDPPNITYTPFTGLYGTDIFTFVADDGTDSSDVAFVTVDIIALINTPPVAIEQTLELLEDTEISFELTGSDEDGDVLELVVVAFPQNGSTVGKSPLFTYRPDANFNGSDVLQFRASDFVDPSDSAGIFFNVMPVNDAPQLMIQSSVEVTTGDIANIQFSIEDIDSQAQTLSVQIVSEPANGQVTISPPSLLNYRPDQGFVGSDEFVVRATDGDLTSSNQTVQVTVADVPQGGPSQPSAVIEPQSPADGDDLVCVLSVASTHPTGAPITYSATWKLNGDVFPQQVADTGLTFEGPLNTNFLNDTIPAADTTPGDLWECKIEASDGTDSSSSSRFEVTIMP